MRFAWVLLGLSLAARAGAVPLKDVQRPATNDFILRAAAAEADAIAQRHGLQVVARLAAAPDGDGLSVVLVRAASSAAPDAVLQDVRGGEPGALDIEAVVLAALPETGSEVKLDQRTRAILGAVANPTETQLGSQRLWTAYVRQPAADLLRLAEANQLYLGAGVVAIIDTGVDPSHPVLRDALVPGYDFTRGQPGSASEWDDLLDQRTRAILGQQAGTPLAGATGTRLGAAATVILNGSSSTTIDPTTVPPDFGHGTMVAGVIHRVAPGAKIMPLKAFNANGYASLFDVVQAIYYAVDHGAKVVNMSFSVGAYSAELLRAINYAARQGVTCVAAAGNDGQQTIVYPAALGDAIGVASTTVRDYLSDFSNSGDDLVTLAAPGEDVVTTYPGGGWAIVSGTSFSAPWVSGAVALFVDKNHAGQQPARTNYFLAVDALAHSLPVHGAGHALSGRGRLDVKQALDGLETP
ncbi:MAG TPA: S8 family serine peptidase [Thermoanaerobaculia bacterium]|nr:S8 family serine peptidase [Thermoanaerobaculia bacterium]